jgi:hypothetical protein
MRGSREPAQTFVVAALAMTCMLGALSMVVDAGVFFVIQHQLQNAADAAVLAAVWHSPACDGTNMSPGGCQTLPVTPASECAQPPNSDYNSDPCSAAVEMVKANWSSVLGLCAGPNLPGDPNRVQINVYPGVPPGYPYQLPLTVYVVSVSCDAPRWFARVLPGLTPTVHLNANAAARLGWVDANGQIQATPPNPPAPARLVARLIPS